MAYRDTGFEFKSGKEESHQVTLALTFLGIKLGVGVAHKVIIELFSGVPLKASLAAVDAHDPDWLRGDILCFELLQ